MHGQHLLEDEEEEEIKEEVLDQENSIPNIGWKKGYTDLSVPIKQFWQDDMERLMSELEEAERNQPAAAKVFQALKETISQLRTKEHMTLSDINTLTKQKELLLHKLNTLEDTNQTLRDLLEEGSSREIGSQHSAETEPIMEQLKERRDKREREKEALRKAIRAQKEQAERSEEYAEALNAQLAEKDNYVAEALSTLESWRTRYNQVVKEKSDLELGIVMLNSRITYLLEQQDSIEDKMREDRDVLVDKLHRRVTESTSFQLENERLKNSMVPLEEKSEVEEVPLEEKSEVEEVPLEEKSEVEEVPLEEKSEVARLKASLKNYEGRIETYKNEVMKTRMEADEVTVKLELCDKENKSLKEEINKEIENAREEFQSQLAELEKLPEILRITETKLAECQDQLKSYEKKNMDL